MLFIASVQGETQPGICYKKSLNVLFMVYLSTQARATRLVSVMYLVLLSSSRFFPFFLLHRILL